MTIKQRLESPGADTVVRVLVLLTLVVGIFSGIQSTRNQSKISDVAHRADRRSSCQASFNKATNERANFLQDTAVSVATSLDKVEIASGELWTLTAQLVRNPATDAATRLKNNALFLEKLDTYNTAIAQYNASRKELVKKQAAKPLPKIEDYCDS